MVSGKELRQLVAASRPEHEPKIPGKNQVFTLPFRDLAWKDFEMLILDLVDAQQDVDGASLYGVEGSAQEGIDIYAPLTAGGYDVVQCKRVQDFGPSKIREMIDLFLGKREDGSAYLDEKGNPPPPLTDEDGNIYPRWPDQTRNFILAISMDLDTPQKQREIEKVKARLKAEGINFKLWDPRHLNRNLRELPKIVDLHFSRAMVRAFCGEKAAASLGSLSEAEKQILLAQASMIDLQELLVGRVEAVQTNISEIREQGVRLSSQGLQDLLQGISTLPLPKEPEAPSEVDDAFSRELEVLRTHVNAGHGNADAASAKLAELLPKVSEQPRTRQAQFHRIKGGYHYNLEQYEDCADAYDMAYDLDPAAENATKLKAMAHLLRHEGAPGLRYLKQAHQAKPDDEGVTAMFVEAFILTSNWDELDKLEQALQPEQLELGIQLARKHMERRDWPRMEAILNILTYGPHRGDPHVQLLLGKYHLHQLADDSIVMPEAIRALEAQRSPALQQAEEHLNNAVQGLDRGDVLRALRTEALNARQVLRCLSRHYRESLSDGRKALSVDPTLTSVQHNLAIAHLRLKEPHAALQVLDDFGDAVLTEVPSSSIIFASAARRAGDLQRSLYLVEQAPAQTNEHYRIELLNEHINTLIELQRLPEARALVDAETSTSALVFVTRAVVDIAEGNHAQAEQDFEAAIQSADPNDVVTRVDYSSYLASRGKATQAVPWIESLDWTTVPDAWLEDMIVTLYQGHAFTSARTAITERRRRGAMQNMMPAVIEGHLATLDGDLAIAIPRFIEAVERWPAEPWPKMHLAAAYSRLGGRDKARPLIKQLSQEQKMPWWMFYEASKTASQLEMPSEARRLAYQAVRRGFEHEETHVNFFNIMHNFKEGPISPIVRAETAVQIEDIDAGTSPSQPRWIVITDDPDPEISRGEFAPSDPFARALLGKAAGQKVTLMGGQTLLIKQVISKFSNAERVWLTEGRTLFPLSRRLQQFRIGELEVLPSEIWDMMRRQDKRNQELFHLINEGVFPATFLGGFRSEAEATLWNFWVGGAAANLSCLGLASEAASALRAARSKSIILHSSALATLNRAGLLRHLAKLKTIVVTRATLDDLNAAQKKAAREEGVAPIRRMEYHNGQVIIREDSLEMLRADRQRLDTLLRFVRGGHVTIRADLGLTELVDDNDLAAHAVPSASVFLASRKAGIPVLCDDHPLSAFARDANIYGHGIDVTSSLAYVHALLEAGEIDEDTFTKWTVALASTGQARLPQLTPSIVEAVLQQNELKRNPAMAAILRTIGRNDITLADLTKDTSLLLKHGLLHYPLPESQEVWMRDVLDAVVGERPLPPFYRGLRRSLDERLLYAPIQHARAIDILQRWARNRFDTTVGQPLGDSA